MVADDNCDQSVVSQIVTSQVPGAEMSRVHGKELSFRLPMKSVNHFPGKKTSIVFRSSTDMKIGSHMIYKMLVNIIHINI